LLDFQSVGEAAVSTMANGAFARLRQPHYFFSGRIEAALSIARDVRADVKQSA